PGIAFTVGSVWARDLDDGQVEPSGLFDMHVLPPADAHSMLFCIGSLPDLVRMRLSRRIRELQFGPIFAGLSRFASMGRGRLIETAVALQASQQIDGQSATPAPEPVAIIAAVKENQQACPKQRHEPLQLFKSNLNICCIGSNTLLIYHSGPAAWFFG